MTVWTARCKSEYQFARADGSMHACGNVTRRGALMCDACLSAVVAEPMERTIEVFVSWRAIGLAFAVITIVLLAVR